MGRSGGGEKGLVGGCGREQNHGRHDSVGCVESRVLGYEGGAGREDNYRHVVGE